MADLTTIETQEFLVRAELRAKEKLERERERYGEHAHNGNRPAIRLLENLEEDYAAAQALRVVFEKSMGIWEGDPCKKG